MSPITLQWVGACTLLLAALAIFVGIVTLSYWWIDSLLERRRDHLRSLKARHIGNELISASWWFSESDEAQKAVRLIGEWMCRYGTFIISDVRDEWRKSLAPEKEGG